MSRNPFGVRDVPDPDGADVLAFAGRVRLAGGADDDNAEAWNASSVAPLASLEGTWSSRWSADGCGWHTGRGTISADGTRVYVLFDWDDGAGQGLVDARWDGANRLVGRYLNLSAPDITRPWVGLIVGVGRIDGAHSAGRIDFRRITPRRTAGSGDLAGAGVRGRA